MCDALKEASADVNDDNMLLNAAIVLQEAVEKLLNMPALDDLKSATDDDLGRDYEHGYAPEIQDNAECILLARNALLITGGVIASFQNSENTTPREAG